MRKILSLIRFFDARDLFVLCGFLMLFYGIKERFGQDVALMVVGGIVLVKGLTKWV